MKDLGVERFLNNATYEIMENGVRFKVFGIPYYFNEEDLDRVIHFFMRMLERIRFIRKEKEDLLKRQPTLFPLKDNQSILDAK